MRIPLINLTFIFVTIAVGISPSAIAGVPFTASSDTTKITGPLREDGGIDYVAALNERLGHGVSSQNNGYVTWLRAVGFKQLPSSTREKTISLLGAQGLAGEKSGWEAYPDSEPIDQTAVKMWKEDEYPKLAAYLNRQAGPLDLAVQAAAAPQWWAPAVSTNGTVAWVLLPELNSLREVSRLLCDRALLRAKQGDFDGFLSDVTAAKRLARRAAGWTIIGHLVAAGIDSFANQTIGATAGAGIFSSDQCAKLGKMLDGLDPIPPFWGSVDLGERWSMLDSTQCIAMRKSELLASSHGDDSWLRSLKNMDTNSVDWNVVMSQINGHCDDVVSIVKSPSVRDEQIARRVFEFKISQMQAEENAHHDLSKEAGETNEAYTQRVADGMSVVLLPSIWRADNTCRLGLTLDQTTRALVAAAQYRADKGNWPDTLGALAPAYLTQVPVDIFSASGTDPIRYQKTGAGICLFAHQPPDSTASEIGLGIVPDAPTDGL